MNVYTLVSIDAKPVFFRSDRSKSRVTRVTVLQYDKFIPKLSEIKRFRSPIFHFSNLKFSIENLRKT